MAQGRHIAVDMISSRVGDRGKFVIECFSYLVVAGACLLLLVGGARFIWYVGKGRVAGYRCCQKLVVWRRWCWTFADGGPQPCKPFSGDENRRPIPVKQRLKKMPFNWN